MSRPCSRREIELNRCLVRSQIACCGTGIGAAEQLGCFPEHFHGALTEIGDGDYPGQIQRVKQLGFAAEGVGGLDAGGLFHSRRAWRESEQATNMARCSPATPAILVSNGSMTWKGGAGLSRIRKWNSTWRAVCSADP